MTARRRRYLDDGSMSRREVLRCALAGTGVLLAAPLLAAAATVEPCSRLAAALHEGLQPPDANGLRLPAGFSSRVVARSGDPVLPGAKYRWHGSPDGGACYATPDGGWVYVSNAELPGGYGGVGALRFNPHGEVVDGYSILSGTSLNCAGGRTPWGTWLSCEEFPAGHVWECDPLGGTAAVMRPALGTFKHEAAAVDPDGGHIYLTEDTSDARLYRFTPSRPAQGPQLDLSAGALEVAEVVGGKTGSVRWHPVPDPGAAKVPTARQVPQSTPFPGSEGMVYSNGTVYFVTKYDTCVWAYDTASGSLRIIYDDDRFADPVLTGVDNVVVAPGGEVLVAEDGGDMQLVAITPGGEVAPLLQVVGHIGSEIAGPAFDPSGTRLYVSSQRGRMGLASGGITYEVTGPFAA
jgi:secreted PhoX family phosphatase